MTPTQVIARARKMIQEDPKLGDMMRVAWARVADRIISEAEKFGHPRYVSRHLQNAARLAFLTEFVKGKAPADCTSAANLVIDEYIKEHTR